jgi:hypothetical protein
VFYTKLLDLLPDYEPTMFEICSSSIVLIQLRMCEGQIVCILLVDYCGLVSTIKTSLPIILHDAHKENINFNNYLSVSIANFLAR